MKNEDQAHTATLHCVFERNVMAVTVAEKRPDDKQQDVKPDVSLGLADVEGDLLDDAAETFGMERRLACYEDRSAQLATMLWAVAGASVDHDRALLAGWLREVASRLVVLAELVQEMVS